MTTGDHRAIPRRGLDVRARGKLAAGWGSRIVGLVFIWAAIAKTITPGPFLSVQSTLGIGAMASLTTGLAVALEVALGLALVVLPRAGPVRWTAAGVLVVFTGSLVALLCTSNPPSCGCFGLVVHWLSARQELWLGIGRNLVLLGLLGLPRRGAAMPPARHPGS